MQQPSSIYIELTFEICLFVSDRTELLLRMGETQHYTGLAIWAGKVSWHVLRGKPSEHSLDFAAGLDRHHRCNHRCPPFVCRQAAW